jgi:diguanylate cyclase (GGDEF)-like protein
MEAYILNIFNGLLHMDARALLAILVWENLAAVIIVLGFHNLATFPAEKKNLYQMLIVSILYSFGFLMLFLRGSIPVILTVNLGNTVLFFGFFIKNQLFLVMLKLHSKHTALISFAIMIVSVLIFNFQVILFHGTNIWIFTATAGIVSSFVVPTYLSFFSKESTTLSRSFGTFYLFICLAAIPRMIVALNDNNYTIHTVGISQSLLYLALLLETFCGTIFFFLFLKMDADERIAIFARTDDLTGLVNRRHFLIQGETIFEENKKNQISTVLLFIDIDNFKTINDSYGHKMGDEVLKHYANHIKVITKKTDICCRYGGDEFIILLPNASLEDGIKIGKKIVYDVPSLELSPEITNLTLSSSIGIFYGTPKGNETLAEYIIKSDDAMYGAKRNGRNQIFIRDNL